MHYLPESPILRSQLLGQGCSLHKWWILKLQIPRKPLLPSLPWINNRIRQDNPFLYQYIPHFFRFHHISQALQHHLVVYIPVIVFMTQLCVLFGRAKLFLFLLGHQNVRDLVETLEDGVLDCFQTDFIDIVGICPLAQQQLDHLHIILPDGRNQRRLSPGRCQINICPISLHQQLTELQIIGGSNLIERSNFGHCSQGILDQIRSLLQDLFNHFDVPGIDIVVKVFIVSVHVCESFCGTHFLCQ